MSEFAEGQHVMVRYPRNKQEERGDRSAWPWLAGTIEEVCGPDEWLVVVESRDVARLEDCTPAPDGTPDDDLCFPTCFRDHTEIRPAPGRAASAETTDDLDGLTLGQYREFIERVANAAPGVYDEVMADILRAAS